MEDGYQTPGANPPISRRAMPIGRGAFWLILIAVVFGGVLSLAVSGLLLNALGDWGILPFALFVIVATAVLVVASIGRINDLGWSPLWALLFLVPGAGLVLLLPLLIVGGGAKSTRHRASANARTTPQQSTRERPLAPLLAVAVTTSEHLRAMRQRASASRGESDAVTASLQSSESRLGELESGRGAVVSTVGAATLHEFWLDLPTYSGPIRGASARLSESGSVYSVSEVSGDTKGGLGGAVAGGLIAGPVGAIVGSNISRKTTVETKTRTVDGRTYELEIIGPGFAYSVRRSTRDELGRFRDLLNARGSSNETVDSLLDPQRQIVDRLRAQLQESRARHEAIQAALTAAQYDSERAWNACRSACVSLSDRLRVWWVKQRLPGSDALAR